VAVTPRDVTPPSPPANLVAVPSGATVRLTWSASPERDVVQYIVYRAAAGGAFERVGSTRAPTATFVDRDVPRGTYRYVVTAEDAGARPNESGRSNEVAVTVP
jgi:penicillin-binding protein